MRGSRQGGASAGAGARGNRLNESRMADAAMKSAEKYEIGQLTDATLEKYNRRGPRYTSYPTAPVWKDDFGPDDVEKVFAAADAKATPVSLYMHIPFCESLCLFCACNMIITKDHSVAPPYL